MCTYILIHIQYIIHIIYYIASLYSMVIPCLFACTFDVRGREFSVCLV